MYKYLLYFLIFSFSGWCAEVVFHLFKSGRLVNRGLARGPMCPIYGVGITLSSLLFGSVKSFVLLALLSMSVATAVEFAVGYFSEHVLSERLWDYTTEKGNIFGYVCPRFSLIWGVVCASVLKLLPRLDGLLVVLDRPVFYVISFLLLILTLVDERLSAERKVRRAKRSALG